MQKILPKDLKKEIIRNIPDAVIEIAEEDGYEIYAVGGCIRNLILDRNIDDIDISVVGDAPELAGKVAARLDSGKVAIYSRYGTALLRIGGKSYEFATARSESYSPDSRKPKEIEPVSIDSDLKRRDFTINALALGLTGPRAGELIDLFDGLIDLDRQILRTPLNPDITFSDDPLRMLRGIRFAAEYSFRIENGTLEGLKRNVSRIKIVAEERIADEMMKMLSGYDPVGAMNLLIVSGLMEIILPEVTAMGGVEQVGRHHHKDVLIHSLKVMTHVAEKSTDPILRLAGLLHDIGKPHTKKFVQEQGWTFHGHEVVGARIARRIGRRLHIGKENTDRLTGLIRRHMRPINLTSETVSDSAIRRLMFEAGDKLDEQLILCRADITTANPRLVDKYLANFDEMQRRMGDVDARDHMRNFQSPVGGAEIIKMCNIEPGPLVGALKGRIEDAILDGIIPYNYEAAAEYLLKIREEVVNTELD
ncbi:MAG: HD domain-containing protein, partial [Calditrichaeota bacterium]|nr:HD domain-containing protein [Calditrichota bacterium]